MKNKTKKSAQPDEKDSTYFLKLVLFLILGSFWIKFKAPVEVGGFIFNGFPLGLFVGLLFASHDHFAIDRKIEYAVLLLVTVVAFFLPMGILL